MIYKAIKGTDMYDKFENKLIFGAKADYITRESKQNIYSQLREATNEEIADEFNECPEFDNDLFEELAHRAGIEMDNYINENKELDRDKWQEDVSNKLGIKLF